MQLIKSINEKKMKSKKEKSYETVSMKKGRKET